MRTPFALLVGLCLAAPLAAADSTRADVVGYVDSDGDGRNDRFRDADGDGRNDVDRKPYRHRFALVDEDGDGDGRNDITGARIADDLQGRRYGRVDEATGLVLEDFFDEDGDGMHDAWAARPPLRPLDLFIDEDGDGIADGRAVRGRPMPPVRPGRGQPPPPADDGTARRAPEDDPGRRGADPGPRHDPPRRGQGGRR